MMWLVLLTLVAAVLVVFLRRRPAEVAGRELAYDNVSSASEDDLVALFTAAITEFEGTSDFKVLHIRPSGRSWTLTGRQDQMHGRL